MATEEPEYSVLEKDDAFELRAYAPIIIAETLVDGQMDDASSAGFKVIANYIFGNNTAPSGSAENISMTAPVTMAAGAETIKMTSPVSMQASDGKWRIHFVMPSEYTMETLPKPNNPAVMIRQIPPTKYAVIQFSGFTGEEKVAVKTKLLLEWMQKQGITPQGAPALARYNPPWTLPFLRRNEVMVAY